MKSADVGAKGHLKGKSQEEVFRAHHNLNSEGQPSHGIEHTGEGCQCDDCAGYRKSKKNKDTDAG